MWIRSQDRKILVKVTDLNVNKCRDKFRINGANENCIGDNDFWVLGMYDTKERAIKVLDEIERRIVISTIAENSNSIQAMADTLSQSEFEDWCCDVFAYQMPEE